MVKTVLGWMVCGPATNENTLFRGKPVHYSVNRVAVEEVQQLIIQQYNTDFLEHLYDDKEEMSQEDKLFMQSVQKTTKFMDGCENGQQPLCSQTASCWSEEKADEEQRVSKGLQKLYELYTGKRLLHGSSSKSAFLRRRQGLVCPTPRGYRKKKISVVFDCNATFQDVSLNPSTRKLTKVSKGGTKYHNPKEPFAERWTQACQKSFEEIIEKLTSSPVLGFKNPELPYVLHTDRVPLDLERHCTKSRMHRELYLCEPVSQ